jgi:hypothetical protein
MIQGKTKVKRKNLSGALRFTVLQRDGHRCRYCGATAAEARLHVDHVHPVAHGGRDTLENLVTACQTCNLGKTAKLGVMPPARADELEAGPVEFGDVVVSTCTGEIGLYDDDEPLDENDDSDDPEIVAVVYPGQFGGEYYQMAPDEMRKATPGEAMVWWRKVWKKGFYRCDREFHGAMAAHLRHPVPQELLEGLNCDPWLVTQLWEQLTRPEGPPPDAPVAMAKAG